MYIVSKLRLSIIENTTVTNRSLYPLQKKSLNQSPNLNNKTKICNPTHPQKYLKYYSTNHFQKKKANKKKNTPPIPTSNADIIIKTCDFSAALVKVMGQSRSNFSFFLYFLLSNTS
jgi:hypothetical protein